MSNKKEKMDEVPKENVENAKKSEDLEKLSKLLTGDKRKEDNEEPSEETKEEKPEAVLPKSLPEDYRDKMYDPMKGSELVNPAQLTGITGDITSGDSDKQSYLKAVLNDEPVIMPVELLDGKVTIEIRSKSTWEQNLTYEAALKDQEEDVVGDYYQAMVQMQKYGAMCQILSINGKQFSTKVYEKPKDSDWRKQREELRAETMEVMDSMNNARMTLLLNALRIFEYKLAEMTSQCNNGNFWKPVD